MTDQTSILLEIRNEQERQRGVLESITRKLGMLDAREEVEHRIDRQEGFLRYHRARGQNVLKRFRAGLEAKQEQGEEAS